MDIGKAFTYVFEDKNWPVKLLIGGVLLFIPIANFISIGYALTALRNVAEGKEEPLPEWDDWAGYFTKGLMVFLAGLVYALPALVLWGFGLVLIAIAKGREGALMFLIALCAALAGCLTTLYGIALGLWIPGAITNYLSKGNFGAFFSFEEIFRYITANVGNYFVAWILSIVALVVASIVGVILCIVGIVFTSFLAYLIWAHLFGQVWRLASEKLTL